MSRPRIVCVIGPTASGKSALAAQLAERFAGEIVSADSRQIYRRLDIGTAKPSPAERARVAHHCLDLVDPGSPFDAARFREAGAGAIADIVARGKTAVVAGGTGLYVRVLLRGLCPAPPASPALRSALRRLLEARGTAALHRALAALDPESAARIDAHDWLQADRIIQLIKDDEKRGKIRLAYIEARLAAGEFEAVVDVAEETKDSKERDDFLLSLARSQAKAGLVDEAIRTAERINWVLSMVDALRTIVPALSKAYRLEDANYAVDAAIQIVRKLPEHPVVLARTYSWLGMIQHELGEDQVARATLMLARNAGLSIEDDEIREQLLRETGEALAAAGARDDAIATFRDAASAVALNPSLMFFKLRWIAEAMVIVGLV